MAIGDLEIRMAHLEGAYEQLNERVGALDADIRGLRDDVAGIRAGVVGVQAAVAAVRADLVRVPTDGVTRTNARNSCRAWTGSSSGCSDCWSSRSSYRSRGR